MRRSLNVGMAVLAALVCVAGFTTKSVYPEQRPSLEGYRRPASVPFPDNDPYTAAKSELGRELFFDPIFSDSRTRSCATCHNPSLSWADGLPHAVGAGSMRIRSPTLIDIAWVPRLGWDGKFRNIESVAFGPITAAANMNLPEPKLIERLSAVPGYVQGFARAFPDGSINRHNIESALATYERTIVSETAPFDRWVAGDESAIDAAAKRGFELFNGKAHCAACHSGWAFTDGSFHDIGTATGEDVGRGRLFPSSKKLRYAFKTPTLRDAARRGPYMHDGSVPTLEAVLELYDKGGIDRPSRSETIVPLHLRVQEKADLVAFLGTLTETPRPVPVPILPR